jgi:histidine triad (HIT) family protein
MRDCIFCKIVKKEMAADILYENEDLLAINDIYPLAPVHVLIIPKKHIRSVTDITEEDESLMGSLLLAAKKLAEDLNIARQGYKLLIRAGEHGGQEINHLHLHLIGGAPLYEDIRPV